MFNALPKRPVSERTVKWSTLIRNNKASALVLNDIASVQALDRRTGSVFYMDVQYGSDKGNITSGDTMLSSLTGHNRTSNGRKYASTLIEGEAITGSEDGVVAGTYTLAYAPGVDVTTSRRSSPEKAIVLKDADGTVYASDNNSFSGSATEHAGTLKTSANVEVGTVRADGVVTLSGAAPSSGGYYIDYSYQYDLPVDDYGNRDGVPEANIAMAQSVVTAIDFPIRSKYSLGAAIDVQKAHGISKLVPSYSNVCRKAA